MAEEKGVTNAFAIEYYKKFSDQIISKEQLIKLFADKMQCSPSDINDRALLTALNRIKHKEKKLRGKYKLQWRNEAFVVPHSHPSSDSSNVSMLDPSSSSESHLQKSVSPIASTSQPGVKGTSETLVMKRQLVKVMSDKASLESRLKSVREKARRNVEVLKQSRRKLERAKKNRDASIKLVTEMKDLKKQVASLTKSVELKNKKIMQLNKRVKSMSNAKTEAQELRNVNKDLNVELREAKNLLEVYEPLRASVIEHNELLVQENSELKKANKELHDSVDLLEAREEESPVVCLFEQTKRFTLKTVECIMNLDGLNIANKSIPHAIREVLKLVDKVPNRVPSRQTIDNYARAKGVVSRKQLAEVLPEKEHTTLYTDETRKFGKTYNVYIATDANLDSFLLGLREMSNKSAKTCMDTFEEIISDISDIARNSDIGEMIVFRIKNTMSDRAQTEVAFNRLLEEYRSEILPRVCENWHNLTEEERQSLSRLNNFFCGLHLLVSFAEVCSTALFKYETAQEDVEDNNDEDGESQRNESSIIRCIRSTSKCLARGADEKSGCFQDFRTYCSTENETVRFVSFHGNRFNIVFFLAQVTHYHRDRIIHFFEEVHGTSNRLQSSVLNDIKKPFVAAGCRVLGLFSKLVSAPLWRLLEGGQHIMDMNTHYLQLVRFFERTCEDPAAFLRGEDCPFSEDLVDRDAVFRALIIPSTEEIENHVGPITHALFTALHQLILRMVKDHLPGGRYEEVGPQDRATMQSVIPHNKLPEFVFGQLDFLVRYRPNASALVNESFLMYAMNKTGQWLENLDPAEKETLLSSVHKEKRKYRELFKDHSRLIAEDRKRRLQEKTDALQAKRVRLANMREDLTTKIIYYGLWQSDEQMEAVLLELQSVKEQTEALKKQLQFRKTVLKQVADKSLFLVGSKGGGTKYKKFSLQKLKDNLSTLINMSLRGPSREEQKTGKPLLVGKRVKHTFKEGTWNGYVISVVPGYPAWYNIIYDGSPTVYSYPLQDDYRKKDLVLLPEPAGSSKSTVEVELLVYNQITNQS